MGTILTRANEAFRDYVTDQVPSSGIYEPLKALIRALFGIVDTKVESVTTELANVQDAAEAGTRYFPTLAEMNAYTTAAAFQTADVAEDGNRYFWDAEEEEWVLRGPNPDARLTAVESQVSEVGMSDLPGAQGVTYVVNAEGNVIMAEAPSDDPSYGGFWNQLVANAAAGAAVADVYGGAVLPSAAGRTFIVDASGNVTWEGDSWNPAASGGGGGSTTVELPLATDGGTLHRLRALLATKLKDSTGIIRVGLIGDSWTDNTVISTQLKGFLTTAYGTSGYGWISSDGGALSGLTHTRSGWTDFDASDLSGSPISEPDPAIGSAIDGKAMSATGTSATDAITVQCEAFHIYYRDGDGTFRYRVDAGSWTSVAGTSSGDRAVVNITGLSDASHTVDIDLTGNTGTVVIYGYRATRTAAGIEFNQLGNGGIEGEQWLPVLPYQPDYWTDLALDVLIVILGTNDYRSSRYNVLVNYAAAIEGLVEGARDAVSDVGVILWAPADTNGSPQRPLTDFVEEMYRLSGEDELDCEFFNHNKLFGTWAEGDALGLFSNNLHPSALGAYVASKELVRRFFWL